ncbi:tetratricopeptide repeat protein [Belliella pelovolcani]|uniref:Tetratricopeptide repeat-containing protein n=1 Tax=Belliella pelovolcani TaxID=529505 RepID=A0A1N7KNG3_9BACT|nr:tetratricopeptide repeat protein [Belliella pelovolcani]SIS63152.1 Tetratricopeptide repeat-containing protein [Belliella pelovolcani]
MKLKFVLAGLVTFMVAGFAQAQDGWNWPSDEKMEAKAREYNAAYVDYMKAEQFVEATKPLNWLLVNVPDLNESIYINGVTVYNGAQNAVSEATQKRVYQDSVLLIYDLRKEKYDKESIWIENKASYGYSYYKVDKNKIPEVIKVFDRVVEVNGEFSYPQLLAAYYDLVYKNYAYHKAYTKEEILEKYDQITKLVDAAEANGANVAQATGIRDVLIVEMDLIDCNFIENTLGAKFKANPQDEVLANQIFKYSVQYKCTSTEAFNLALEYIDTTNPSFNTSQVRAMRMLQNKDYEKAQPLLEKALTLAENDEQKSEVYLDLAKVHAQSGRKGAARSSAMEVVKLGTEKSKDAWTLIAQLYMESFNDCKGGVSRAKDRSVYIAAYNAYQRAGNTAGMNQAKNQFPSKEELFTEGLQAGQTINTGCWIGETVTLATRD